jgi:hypothetical protein
LRPQFLDHPVWLQGGLRVHILEQNFEQCLELALVSEAAAAENSFDLFPYGIAVYQLSNLPNRECKTRIAYMFQGSDRQLLHRGGLVKQQPKNELLYRVTGTNSMGGWVGVLSAEVGVALLRGGFVLS